MTLHKGEFPPARQVIDATAAGFNGMGARGR